MVIEYYAGEVCARGMCARYDSEMGERVCAGGRIKSTKESTLSPNNGKFPLSTAAKIKENELLQFLLYPLQSN